MLPCSHVVPINSVAAPLHSPGELADAFSEFISASSLLEASYRDLQLEVAHLGFELAERNAALTRSLAENDRMRAALQQIIDSMPCGVLVSDAAETIVTINPKGADCLSSEMPIAGPTRTLRIKPDRLPFSCERIGRSFRQRIMRIIRCGKALAGDRQPEAALPVCQQRA